ncbi:MAG: histidine kinase N-terminal 7TM domain-containing protein [Candidatus Nanoarchaeia archaeon]|nr:histidine kinase N-terminal 7TM domain-containing protein [Candidatus Nanoarchaeia archaeon]
MDFASFLYITPHILSGIIFFIFILYLNSKIKNNIVKYFLILMVNCFLLSFFKILELLSKSEFYTIFFSKLYYSFLILLPFFILIFVLNYLEEKDVKKFYHILYLNVIAVILLITNEYHLWYFSSTQVLQVFQTELSSLITERGPAGFVFLFYNYGMVLFSSFLLLKKLLEKNYIYKNQILMLLIGITVPFVSNMFFSLNLFNLNFQSDLTIFSFTITAFSFLFSFLNYKFLNLSPLARKEVFDELNDALLILNEKGEIVDFNKKALELSKKLGIKTFKNGMNAKDILKNTKLDIENDSEFSISEGMPLYYNSSIKKMIVNNVNIGLILSVKDVTKIREYENLKAQAKKEKEITNLREEFITRVSHELRQPMMPIIGYSNELKGMVKSEKANEYIEKIIFNSENLKELIEKTIRLTQIKTQSKINMEKRKLSNFSKNLMKDARIKMKIIKDSEVLIDESQMIEAANNIIENALKYSKKEVEIEISEKDKNAIITITDKGKGISKELIKQIIDSSYLAKIDSSELRKGFGIGLLIAKMIIQAHSGKMEIKSEKDKGTTVKIILPTA